MNDERRCSGTAVLRSQSVHMHAATSPKLDTVPTTAICTSPVPSVIVQMRQDSTLQRAKPAPPDTHQPIAPFAQGPKIPNPCTAGMLYVVGLVAVDSTQQLVCPNDPQGQARYVLRTLEQQLQAARYTLDCVCMVSIYLSDWANYQAVMSAYTQSFPHDRPARFCIQSPLSAAGALVEIACVARPLPAYAAAA